MVRNLHRWTPRCSYLQLPAATCCYLLLPAATCSSPAATCSSPAATCCRLLLPAATCSSPAATCCCLQLPAATCCCLQLTCSFTVHLLLTHLYLQVYGPLETRFETRQDLLLLDLETERRHDQNQNQRWTAHTPSSLHESHNNNQL